MARKEARKQTHVKVQSLYLKTFALKFSIKHSHQALAFSHPSLFPERNSFDSFAEMPAMSWKDLLPPMMTDHSGQNAQPFWEMSSI